MFQIKWAVSASNQRADILEFWIEHNKSEAFSRMLLKETLRTEKLLQKNSYLGRPTDLQGIKRILVLKNSALYYIVFDELIEIVAFRDNRKNPENFEI